MIITSELRRARAAHENVSVLPERLPRAWRPILAGADAAIVFFVSLLALNGGSGSRIAAAIVTAAIVCGIFWVCGYYRRSFAVYPRDEIYYACAGVLLAALPVAAILSGVGDIPVVAIAAALLLSALATSVLRYRMHLERRRDAPAPYGGATSISPAAWHDREQQLFIVSKRLFDVAVALAALVVFSPIMLAAAIAIARESSGPVFFRQDRVGKDGRPFRIFKFRTMRLDSGDAWVKPGDNRITKMGAFLRRTSLDELPQIFNVLRGEMSIVGPRPEMISFARDFTSAIPNYAQRHIVQPGITGWAQVYVKRNLEPGDMSGVLPFDLFYVEHASLLLDVAIILKTASEVLFHRAV